MKFNIIVFIAVMSLLGSAVYAEPCKIAVSTPEGEGLRAYTDSYALGIVLPQLEKRGFVTVPKEQADYELSVLEIARSVDTNLPDMRSFSNFVSGYKYYYWQYSIALLIQRKGAAISYDSSETRERNLNPLIPEAAAQIDSCEALNKAFRCYIANGGEACTFVMPEKAKQQEQTPAWDYGSNSAE